MNYMSNLNDLISKVAAIGALVKYADSIDETNVLADWLIPIIRDLPAVDAAPIVHGKLIKHEPDMHGIEPLECSACNYLFTRLYPQNYCPNCGAKLDGERT